MSDDGRTLGGLALCAGYGGLELGLHIAEPRYQTVCFVERETHAAAALVARMEDAALDRAPVWDDVKSFDGRPWRGKVDILTAGYPCQPFTFSGLRRGADDPRHLWPDVARIIGEVRPALVFCENVDGHLDLGFPDVAGDLRAMGYGVKAGLFSAFEAGASHQRRRLFLLAYADGGDGRQPRGARPRRRRPSDTGRDRPDRLPGGTACRGQGLDMLLPAGKATGRAFRPDNGSIPLFAPAPGDLVSWDAVLHRQPDLQPCFFGLDDGLAGGMERRKAAGNGVVPLAAALAWRTLTAGLGV